MQILDTIFIHSFVRLDYNFHNYTYNFDILPQRDQLFYILGLKYLKEHSKNYFDKLSICKSFCSDLAIE